MKENFMLAILSYKIINVYMIDNEKIVIGDGGIAKSSISYRPFGFCIKSHNSAKWYSFMAIKKIEVFGHEF